MLRISRVLHATDFSPSARSAMEYSLMLARLLGVRVDVLHVMAGLEVQGLTEYRSADVAAEQSPLDQWLAEGFGALSKLADAADAPVRFLVGRGPLPGPVILEEAKREGANLIVLGAHGGGEAEQDKLGSVSTDIVRRSTCPVLIIPPHVAEGTTDENLERLVAFVSYAHLIEPVILVAAQIARLLGARLDVLVHVSGTGLDASGSDWQSVEKRLRGILERYERKSGETISSDRIEFHPIGNGGAEQILQYATDDRSDMIVLEAPGLASMDSPLEQTVEELVGRSPCPVILINTCGRALTDVLPSRKMEPARTEEVVA